MQARESGLATNPIKLYPTKSKRLSAWQLGLNVTLNALASGGSSVAIALGLRELLIYETPAAWTTVVFEARAMTAGALDQHTLKTY